MYRVIAGDVFVGTELYFCSVSHIKVEIEVEKNTDTDTRTVVVEVNSQELVRNYYVKKSICAT